MPDSGEGVIISCDEMIAEKTHAEEGDLEGEQGAVMEDVEPPCRALCCRVIGEKLKQDGVDAEAVTLRPREERFKRRLLVASPSKLLRFKVFCGVDLSEQRLLLRDSGMLELDGENPVSTLAEVGRRIIPPQPPPLL